ncbi:MAG: integrase [Candidatus Fluviicola riflensis]|nr:MAG: integrase [Candidatus Fluviicola riflensis]OGS76654.1 MAG: integrase [Candidatus Fluviicola riflensis]OGS82991.1 MAG: integrase [Fluviicola sp. RIFCSPHIGHO2_01_FULL_43_53]OGS88385.1 MAG: integrase [Fluviicola sp. RIFCSPHIGHO2_12_FULL_43_24]
MTSLRAIEQFEVYLATEKRYSEHTLIAYKNDLQQFVDYAEITEDRQLAEVNHQLVRGWMVELLEQSIVPRSVSRKLSCLRSFFNWLKKEGLVTENPMLKVRGPKVEKRLPQFVKQSEFTNERIDPIFANNFDGTRDRLMVELFYQTGIRLSELINLKEQDVVSTHIKVLGKRNKERVIPIGKELFELICEYRSGKPDGPDSGNLLFVKIDGVKLSSKFVYRKINTYLGRVTNTQKKSPHILRHTFATHMLNNGAGLETLKELLGHANLSATQVYTHNSFAQINNIYSQAHPRGRKN